MTTNDMHDDRPTLDDQHALIRDLRNDAARARAAGDLTALRSIESQHRSAMRAYRAMQYLRIAGKDPREYWGPTR